MGEYRSGKDAQGITQAFTNRYWSALQGTTTGDTRQVLEVLDVIRFDSVVVVPIVRSGGALHVRVEAAFNEDGEPDWHDFAESLDITAASNPRESTITFTLHDTAVKRIRVSVQPVMSGADGTYAVYVTCPFLKG